MVKLKSEPIPPNQFGRANKGSTKSALVGLVVAVALVVAVSCINQFN